MTKQTTKTQWDLCSRVQLGDAEKLFETVKSETVDLVLSDPPYEKKYEALWGWFARESARVLKSGGSLVSLTGHFNIDHVLNVCSEHLRFWWLCGMAHPGNLNRLPGKWVCVRFKPAVWFVKGRRFKQDTDCPVDLLDGNAKEALAQKALHRWGQPINWFRHWIERLTPPNGVVLDPFAGSLTVAIAGRRYICFERDQEHLDRALPVLEGLKVSSPSSSKFSELRHALAGLESALDRVAAESKTLGVESIARWSQMRQKSVEGWRDRIENR